MADLAAEIERAGPPVNGGATAPADACEALGRAGSDDALRRPRKAALP